MPRRFDYAALRPPTRVSTTMWAGRNTLYYGDNLKVLRQHLPEASVDLVYLDPPFNSNADYNVLFRDQDSRRSAAQIKAFEDTWSWDAESARVFEDLVAEGGRVSDVMQAFRTFLGTSDMLAYLTMMAPRLLELRRVMKPTGSIYLHCDSTANHYLKILMDSIFGPENFRSEIVWYYYNKMHDSRKKLWPKANDTILFYVKDHASEFPFKQLQEKRDEPVKQLLRVKVDGVLRNKKDADGHVMYRMKEEKTMDNVWRIPALQPAAQERLGYPTQKPEAILERIIEASSRPGDVVLDPFCGCGTAVAVAERLNRKWVGIDITHLATNLIKHRMAGFEVAPKYDVVGEPETIDEAEKLAHEDPYQFQFWALGLVGARPHEEKKGADRGIDGRRRFFEKPGSGGAAREVIFSVKAGKVQASHVRDLRGVVDREKAAFGVLITFEKPTGPMVKEATGAGFTTVHGYDGQRKYQKLQIITVGELLAKKQLDLPAFALQGGDATLKAAPVREQEKAKKGRVAKIGEFKA